jgi:hypothetical protein
MQFFLHWFILSLTLTYTAQVQLQEVKGVFGSPLKLELLSTGTFGEPRGEHFHAGLDMKTMGQIGFDIYTVKQGYISRIRVSATGYGKAIYINHPNGYTSVYAHMEEFNSDLTAYVKEQQYKQKSFEVDLFPNANQFSVDSAYIIGKSGNTGGSAGPHLHFEIRKTATEIPMNPLLFGYPLEDNVPPLLYNIHVVNTNKGYYESKGKTYPLLKQDTIYTVNSGFVMVEEGNIGISVNGWDKHTKTINKNGIYSMVLEADGKSIFKFKMDGVSFDDARYVHAFTHYGIKRETKSIYYNCFKLPGNNLKIYSNLVNNGFIPIANGDTVPVHVAAIDHAGNRSSVRFKLVGTPKTEDVMPEHKHLFNKDNSIERDDFKMLIPSGTLFDHTILNYFSTPSIKKNTFSPIHVVDNKQVPFFKRVTLKIKPLNLPERLKEKAVISFEDFKGNISSLTSTWEGDFLTAAPRATGKFYIQTDTIKPTIRLLNFNDKTANFRGSSIRVNITDNFSGIKSYAGYIDDKWVLFEYDAKSNLLVYQFDEKCPRGEHILKIIVKDDVNNTQILERKFYY